MADHPYMHNSFESPSISSDNSKKSLRELWRHDPQKSLQLADYEYDAQLIRQKYQKFHEQGDKFHASNTNKFQNCNNFQIAIVFKIFKMSNIFKITEIIKITTFHFLHILIWM